MPYLSAVVVSILSRFFLSVYSYHIGRKRPVTTPPAVLEHAARLRGKHIFGCDAYVILASCVHLDPDPHVEGPRIAGHVAVRLLPTSTSSWIET